MLGRRRRVPGRTPRARSPDQGPHLASSYPLCVVPAYVCASVVIPACGCVRGKSDRRRVGAQVPIQEGLSVSEIMEALDACPGLR